MKRKTFILTLMMMLCSFAFGQASYYWPQPSYDWPNTANYTCVIQINGEKVSNSNYELGAFCGEILRGRQRLSGSGETARYYLNVYGEGDKSETITFKLYDHNTKEVLDIACETTFALVANETKGEYLNPFVIKFNDYVAQVGANKYSTLAAAFAAATDDQTVVMLKNVTEEFAISNTANVTFDMAGYTLTGAIKPSTANLTVTNGTIDNNNTSYSAIEINEGSLVLKNDVVVNSARHALRIDGEVTATIEGGEYKSAQGTGKGTYHAANISGKAKVTILGGKFVGPKGTASDSGAAVNVQKDATVAISGGEFSGGKTKTLSSDGTLSLTGGKYDQDVKGFCAAGYTTVKEGNWYTVVKAVAKIGDKYYATFAAAVTAAQNNDKIELLWAEGNAPIAMNASLFGKNVTVTGTATVDWSKDFLFVGRGGEGNAILTFDGANLTSASNSASYGIHVSGREKNTTNKYDGKVVINNSTIELDYLINRGTMKLDNEAVLTVKHGFGIAGRPASETESGDNATATLTLNNNSKVVVNNHNGMGLGQAANVLEGLGIMNIDATSSFETTQSFLVTEKGTMNIAGTAKVVGTLTNNGDITLTAQAATLEAQDGLTIGTTVENSIVIYQGGKYQVAGAAAKIAETGVSYKTLQEAVNACEGVKNTVVLLANNNENVTVVQKEGINVTIDGGKDTRFDYSGTFTIHGNARSNGAETLTFVNIDFTTDKAGHYFIDSNSTASAERYAHNVTVKDCNFTATEAGVNSAAAMRIRQGFNIAINGGEFTNLHSALQAYGNTGITVDGITLNGKNGISAGTSTKVVVKNSNITATGYGVRADGTGAYDMTLANNTITATLPVVVRKTTGEYRLTVESGSYTASNVKGAAVTFTTGDDGTFEAPTANATAKITGDVTTFGFEARIGNEYYTKFDYAYAAATEGQTIELFRTVVITDDYNYDKAITVKADFNDVAFRVKAEVSFNNMTIESNDYCVIVGADAEDGAGKLIINGGTYKGETSVASVTKGTLTINGGEFSIVEYENYDYAYLINCFDANYKNGKATVEIKGGKFYNWNPENNAAEGAGTDFCVAGYIAVENPASVFTVQEGTWVAQIGDVKYQSLQEAIAAVAEGDVVITLLADASLKYGAREAYGKDATQSLTIKGGGHTLTLNQTNSDWSSLGLKNAAATLTFENMIINKSGKGATSGAWNTHAIIFSTDVKMNNVTVNNSVAVAADATLENVTINEANGYYGLWIEANGQTVTMNGGSITATNGGRGIKVADEYISDIKQITLNINGTVFKTAKKAAVLVTSTAGAIITAENVDITNVASDSSNIVWVDEDRAIYFGNVTLNTAYAYVEGGEESYEATAKTDGVFGYYKKLATAIAANNTTDIALLRPMTIAASETVVLDLNGKTVSYTSGVMGEAMITNNGTLTVKNGTIAYRYTGAADSAYTKGNYTINNYGTLTVEANVENNTAPMSHASYAINTNAGATLNVESGNVLNLNGHAIRMVSFGTAANNVNINGGYIEGTRALQVQLPSGSTSTAKPEMNLVIKGGELKSNEETYNLAVYVYSNGQSAEKLNIDIIDGTFNGNVAINAAATATMNEGSVEVIGGTFNGQWGVFSYAEDTNNTIAIKGGAFKTNYSEKYSENDGYIFEFNGTYYIVKVGTYVARNTTTGQGYETLQAAVDAAEAGHTIELLQDITLTGGYANDAEAGLGIELPGNDADDKGLTIEGKGHTIDCGTYTKGIRIYNNITGTPPIVTFNDITIVNNNTDGRCIDTRSGNINLKVNGTNLVATKGNSQPLTIGGTEKIHRVSLGDNTTIDAGNSGYGVICFVSTNVDVITSGNTEIKGLAAFYVKGDALDVQLDLGQGTYTGKNIHSGEGNTFGTVVLEGDNTTVKMIGTKPTIQAIATGTSPQAAFLVLGENNKISIETKTAQIEPQGDNAYWAMIDADVAASTIIRYSEIVGEETVYTRVYPAAEADGFQFMSLEEAVRYAKAGNTVTVVNANTVAEPVVIAKDLTLDLNGKAITATENVYPVIRVQGDANVTVIGEGSITNATDYVFTLGSSNQATAGNLTIKGGTYVGATSVASVTTGTLTINGGDFSLVEGTTDYRYLINCVDANYKNGTAKVAIYGGTFHNWNPEDNAAENPKANFCAPGYIAVENPAGVFTVKEGAWQAQIEGGAKFQKLEDAIVAAGATATINVLSSFETEVSYRIAKTQNITLNLNGQTITGTDNTTKNFGLIQNDGTLTVNGEGALKLAATVNSGWNRYSAVISNNPGATLTVEGGTIEHLGGTDMAYGIDALTNGTIGDVNTTIKGGTIKSTYRAIRQFLNSDSKENNLTVNGGTLEGVNKSIFFHDPSAKANNGTVTVRENAVLNGDVYLFVTDGSLVWPVNVSIAESALNGQLTSANVPDGYVVEERDGFYSVYGEQSYAFVKGWNWFSTYLDYNDIEVFQAPLDANATQIKSQTGFASYSDGGWNNMSLTTVNVEQTYMVKTAPVSFDITAGKVVNPKDHAITIMGAKDKKPSWTWIGYTLGTGISVDEAFPQPNEGDYVKSQDQFALFEAGEWHGSLNVMTPGKGFMYKNVGVEKTHTYPVSVTNTRSRAENVTTENNHWVADARMYPTNMTMVAVLNIDGNEMDDEFEVAAFSNGEVRGSARAIYVSSLGRYMFFMTIYGENNDELTFKYYDIASEEEHAIDFRTVYAENASLGSIKDPRVLHCGALNVEEMSANTIALYPNPTTTGREIKFETTCDMVEVFNSLGVKVAEYRNVNSIDGIETAGVYVIRVTNDSAVQNCRLIVK